MGIMDTIKRRLPDDVMALAEGMAESETHWGRILHIDSGGLGRSRIMLEIHDLDLEPFERWVTTRVPKGHEPRVGDDVYCAQVRGQFAGVDVPYRIHWGRPPRYGRTPVDMADRAQKVFIGHLSRR